MENVEFEQIIVDQRTENCRKGVDSSVQYFRRSACENVTQYAAADTRQHGNENRKKSIVTETAFRGSVDTCHNENRKTEGVEKVDYLRINVKMPDDFFAQKKCDDKNCNRGYDCGQSINGMPERKRREEAEYNITHNTAANGSYRSENDCTENIEFLFDCSNDTRQSEGNRTDNFAK